MKNSRRMLNYSTLTSFVFNSSESEINDAQQIHTEIALWRHIRSGDTLRSNGISTLSSLRHNQNRYYQKTFHYHLHFYIH